MNSDIFITTSDLEKLIKEKSEDSFMSHLKNILNQDYRYKGVIEQNSVKLWRFNSWSGLLYTVFIFVINNEGKVIKTKSKLNSAGKVLHIFNSSLFLSLWIRAFFYIDSLSGFIMAIITLIVFMTAWLLLSIRIYKNERLNELQNICSLLEIKDPVKKEKKEFGFKGIATRIIVYPFCIALILLSIFLLIPDGEYLNAMGAITISGVYLYSDVKIILNKLKNK